MKTLVVEDDMMSQCVLAKVLGERGHEVVSYENAEQAILAYQKQFFPLIFVDVGLPGMDGLHFCKWVRAQPNGGKAFIMVATTQGQPADMAEVLAAGANDFLPKPYEVSALGVRLTVAERQMQEFFERQNLEETLQSTRETLETKARELEADLENARKSVQSESDRRSALEQKIEQLETDRQRSESAHADKLGALERDLKTESTGRQQSESEIARVRDEMAALEQDLGAKLKAAENALRAEEDRRRETEESLRRTCRELEGRLDHQTGHLDKTTALLRAAESRKDETEEALGGARKELEALQRRHADEMAKARESLEEEVRGHKQLADKLERLERDSDHRAGELTAQLERAREEADSRLSSQAAELAATAERLSTETAARTRVESFNSVLLALGKNLGGARTLHEAARLISSAAQDVVGWNACSMDLYSQDNLKSRSLLNIDTVGGRLADVPPTFAGPELHPSLQRVLSDGPQLLSRPGSSSSHTDYLLFGDRAELSACLMYVAIHAGDRVVGFMSLHSYEADAYQPEDLAALQALADHCGGALERIAAEENQRTTDERLQFMFQSTNEVVRDWNMMTDEMWWNEALQTVFGVRNEKSPAGEDSWSDRLHPQDKERVVKKIQSVVQGDQRFWTDEYRFRRQDGSYAQVADRGCVVRDENGDAVRVIAAMTDTSQRNVPGHTESKERVVAPGAPPLAGADTTALTQMAAGVALEFNNLLSVIQGYTALLIQEEGLEPEMTDALKHIASATDRAAHLTQQLLLLGGTQNPDPRPTDLNETLNRESRRLHRILGEGISLQFNHSPGLPPVLADPALLEHVFTNFAIHARDAMPQGGHFIMGTKAVEIEDPHTPPDAGEPPRRYVCLTLTDTGSGIPPELLPHLFEPFSTNRTAGRTAGIGLATAHHIVKQHQGWIDVQSHTGRGTAFSIYLLVAPKAAATADDTSAKPQVRGGTESILLVEDEPAVLQMAKGILERLGYNVFTATSGDDAIRIWREQAPRIDLLLTDIVMPGSVNGRELADKLLQEKSSLKIVYTSGYSRELANPRVASRRDTAFLQKPYPPESLGQVVRQCLDGG